MFGMMRKKAEYLNKLNNPDSVDKIIFLKDDLNDSINEDDLNSNVEEFYNILFQVYSGLIVVR